jgi:hypothetical protein
MSPLNLKTDRYDKELAEFRIFQSTLVPHRIQKNMEFVWALCAWTRQPSGISWDHRDFCAWLGQNQKEYPTLTEYLRKETYTVKGSKGSIPNTWAPLLLTDKQKQKKSGLSKAA